MPESARSSQINLCCFPSSTFGFFKDNDHRVISLNDTDALDFELVEFRPKRRLRVIHILPWTYKNAKNIPCINKPSSSAAHEDSGISSNCSSQSWVKSTSEQGEHPGNIWLYYERPVNYNEKLFRKIISPAAAVKFSQDLSEQIISLACKEINASNLQNLMKPVPPSSLKNCDVDTCDKVLSTGTSIKRSFKHLNLKQNSFSNTRKSKFKQNESLNLPGSCNESEDPGADGCKTEKKSSGKKPFLIFIHDIGYSADVWKLQAVYFSSVGYEVLAVDLIGHGFSCVPQEPSMYSFREITKDVVAVIDSYCSENEPCVIIAEGYGCEIASKIAAHRSSQVQQMVFVGFGYKAENETQDTESGMKSVHQLVRNYFSKIFKSKKHQFVSSAPDHVLQHIIDGKSKKLDIWHYRSILTPTLIVHGLKDLQVNLSEADELEKLLPRSYLELIPDSGHSCMIETSDTFNSIIHYFLKKGSEVLM